MCTPKAPKPKKVDEKPVQYLSNPFLDNLSIGGQMGRNNLRIDLGASRVSQGQPFEGGATPGSQAGAKATRATLGGITSYAPGLVIPTRPRSGAMYAQR